MEPSGGAHRAGPRRPLPPNYATTSAIIVVVVVDGGDFVVVGEGVTGVADVACGGGAVVGVVKKGRSGVGDGRGGFTGHGGREIGKRGEDFLPRAYMEDHWFAKREKERKEEERESGGSETRKGKADQRCNKNAMARREDK